LAIICSFSASPAGRLSAGLSCLPKVDQDFYEGDPSAAGRAIGDSFVKEGWTVRPGDNSEYEMWCGACLVLLAGDHIPVVTVVAPKSFCFGNIGVLHGVSFMLPIAAP
jgi:hypothetical protein